MPISKAEQQILIIEDNPGDFFLIQEHLKEEFALPVIHHAVTLKQAKELLGGNLKFNIIILDLSLPDSTGEVLVTEMIEAAETTPIIVLTGLSDKDFGIKTLAMGVSDYLLKDELTASQLSKSIIYSIERRRIHLQLNHSEEKYRNLFNLSPLPQWVYDVETLRFMDINEAAIAHYGYTVEEFLSMTIADIRPNEDVELLHDIIRNSAKTGTFNKNIVRHKKKNGEIILVTIKGNSINFNGRNARLMLVVDVTENVNAENALTTSEQRFKALVTEGADLMGILDRQGNYTYISPTSEAILGIKPEDLLGKSSIDYVFEEDRERVTQQVALLAKQKRIEIAPFRFRNGNNKYRWIESIITDLTDDPAIGGIVSNSRDVTLRIETEIRIKENIDRYNTVSKATSDAIYEWNFSTNEVIWNKGLKGIFGHKTTGKTSFTWWYEHLHPEDAEKVSQNVKESIKSRKSRWTGEYRFRCANGSYRNVLDRSFLMYDDAGHPTKMIGSIQDITERIQYIQAVERQNEQLREIAWLQSHMVRSPLTRIMGLINVLKNHPDDEDVAEIMRLILTSAHELDEVIRAIVNRADDVSTYVKE